MRFVTPFQSFVPNVLETSPEPGRSAAKYFTPELKRYVNVYIKTDLTVTESQPLWTDVLKFYQGGCVHQVDGPYIKILTDAGYTLG